MIQFLYTIGVIILAGGTFLASYTTLDEIYTDDTHVQAIEVQDLGIGDGAINRLPQWTSSSTLDAIVTRVPDIDIWAGNATGTFAQLCLTGDDCITEWGSGSSFSTEAELEALLSDVSNVFTNNDTIDISDNTNLSVSSPITLTGDSVGINQSLLSITESQISDLGDYIQVGTTSIDSITTLSNLSITESQISDLDHYTDADIDGTESAFTGWDKDASDDFDGVFSSLTSIPAGLSDGDDDTQLTNEQVQDIIGAMVTGNTETNITVTYEDSDGTLDFVASGGGGGGGMATTSIDTEAELESIVTDVSDFFTDNDSASSFITAGTGLSWSTNTLNAEVQTSDLHDAVTLAGEDFLSLSTQQITANAINPDNLASADFGDFTCNGTSCSLDASYLTSVDISDDTNLSVTATGLELSGDAVALSGDYTIPLTASTTEWSTAFGWGDHSAQGYISDLSSFDTDDLSEGATNLYSQWVTSGSDIYFQGGQVGIGEATSPTRALSIWGEDAVNSSVAIERSSDDVFGPYLNFFSSRGSASAQATSTDGDQIGRIEFNGYTGEAYDILGTIYGSVDTTNDVAFGGALNFLTQRASDGSLINRMSISQDGIVDVGNSLTVGNDLQVEDSAYVVGNMAIGTSTIDSDLSVKVADEVANIEFETYTADNVRMELNAGTGTTTPSSALFQMAYDNSLQWGTLTNHPIYTYVNNGLAMSIDTDGQMGIGTTDAQEDIEVQDDGDGATIAMYAGSGDLAGIKMSERVDGDFGIGIFHDGTDNQMEMWSLTSGGALSSLLYRMTRTGLSAYQGGGLYFDSNGNNWNSTIGGDPGTVEFTLGLLTNSHTMSNGLSYSHFLADGDTYTTGGSGVHPIVANVLLTAPVINSGSATVATSTTLYIEGAPTGAGVGSENSALYVNSGYALFKDRVGIGTTTPETSLDVVGTTTISNGSNGLRIIPGTSTTTLEFF